jgi:hypothetical protein
MTFLLQFCKMLRTSIKQFLPGLTVWQLIALNPVPEANPTDESDDPTFWPIIEYQAA